MGLKIDRRAGIALRAIGIAALAVIVFCLVKVFIWETAYYRNKSAESRSPEQAVISSLKAAESPSETAITEEQYDSYQVEARAPRYLEIPRLELKARVKKQTVSNHEMTLPDNIHDVSWYSGSGLPGENTNILISGIDRGLTQAGAFSNLDSLEQNDEVIIETGNHDRHSYKVHEILIINNEDIKNKLPLAQKRIDGKETLALITGRRANDAETGFSSVVIVRAVKD